MRVLVSTTIRNVNPNERSGHLYSIDISEQRVERCSYVVEPPYRDVDDNPRGGMRGCKGISIKPDCVAISNSSSIFLFDPQWNFLQAFTHPSCAGIHDITFQQNRLWVTSARTDMIFQFSLDGDLLDFIYVRECSELKKILKWNPPVLLTKGQILSGEIDFRDPRLYDKETYDNAHINSICQLDSGDLLVSLGLVVENRFQNFVRIKKWLKKRNLWSCILTINRMLRGAFRLSQKMHSDLIIQPVVGRSAIIRLSENKDVKLLFTLEGQTVPGHSLLQVSADIVLYLDTTNGNIIEFRVDDGTIVSSHNVTNGFLRGGVLVQKNLVAVGSNNEIILFDLDKKKIQSRFFYSSNKQEAVYDIKILPSYCELPPVALNELINSKKAENQTSKSR